MAIVVSSEQMKRLDATTINEIGIPSRILMETAGKNIADRLHQSLDTFLNKGVIILCGYGNNGGDGYVIARWLAYYGYQVFIIKVGEGISSPETKANLELCRKIDKIEFIDKNDEDYEEFSESLLLDCGVIIDAIYGIGFKGTLKGDAAEIVEQANDMPLFRVAVDIPSGINADTGSGELAFRADITYTLEAFKYGHLIGNGKVCSGLVQVVPIGIPFELWKKESPAFLLDDNNVNLPIRHPHSHKGDFGRIAVFAGSPGYTGAAFMASLAALKAGAGLVTIFCYPDDMLHFSNKPHEVMVRTTPLQNDCKVDTAALDVTLENFDVILFGPGCGVSDYTLQILEYVAGKWQKPAVIDADGLNTLAQNQHLISKLAEKPVILTPHWGEFCRLAGISMDNLEKDCISALCSYVDKHNLNVLLKSHTTIYYDGNLLQFNTRGNDGLATGGSGDILSGMIAGLLAQKADIDLAAGAAAYHLGLTAEYLAQIQDFRSIIPTDIIDALFLRDIYSKEDEEE